MKIKQIKVIGIIAKLIDVFRYQLMLDKFTRCYFFVFIVIGFLWFVTETWGILLIQNYYNQIGYLQQQKDVLSSYIHIGPTMSLILVIVVFSLRTLIIGLKNYSVQIIYQAFLFENRKKILKKSLNDYLNFKLYKSSAMFNEVVFQAGTYWQQASMFIVNLVLCGSLFIISFLYFKISFLFAFMTVFIFFMILKMLLRGVFTAHHGIVEESIKLSKGLIESLKNLLLIKIYRLESNIEDMTNHDLKRYYKLYKNYSIRTSLETSLPQFIGIIVVFTLAHLFTSLDQENSFNSITFLYMFMRISQSLGDVLTSYTMLCVNEPGWVKLLQWYDEKQNNFEVSQCDKTMHSTGMLEIKAENLSFRYDQSFVFQNLNFHLKPGSICHIAGDSGAGKSTLIALIIGLNKPTAGSILTLGELPYSPASDISKYIGYVGPDSFFIEGNLRENLLLGHYAPETISDETIYYSLEQTSILKELKEMNIDLDFFLNESVPLSTGQKQRINIARALLRNPKILVLDEATSNVDVYNENIILQVIKNIGPEIITIIVSHKGNLSTIANFKIELGHHEHN